MDALAEQIEYYRHRANEYDEWWFRQGRYAMPPAERVRWFADQVEVERALDSFQPAGDVLELACGTGLWTRHLIRYANRITAVDAAPEMISRNHARIGDRAPIKYVTADLFRWQPPARSYDVCFFGYWLSHIPANRLASFWDIVATALRPTGRVFLVDSSGPADASTERQLRQLNDGRRFHVIKRFWQPDELTETARRQWGWALSARNTANGMILYATGRPD